MNNYNKDLNYVFNEMPIYSTEVFQIFTKRENAEIYKINKNEINRFFSYLETKNKKIITNCIWCNKEFSFNYIKLLYQMDDSSRFPQTSDICVAFPEDGGINLNLLNKEIWGLVNKNASINDLIKRNYYITYYISCNNIPSHVYTLNLLIRVEEDKIIVTKVGQFPSLLSVKGFDFDKYKKQLNKYNAYEDYKNADLSMSNNFFAGAYTYLRRVYEKQLNFYLEKNKAELSDNKTETKIKAVKSNFDPRIHEHLGNLYQILSIGIHELDDSESQEYYTYLKAMIDMQLQFEKAKDESEKQSKSLNISISNITTKLKQRKPQEKT